MLRLVTRLLRYCTSCLLFTLPWLAQCWGQENAAHILEVADTCSLYPKAGLALYPLHVAPFDYLRAEYVYSGRDGEYGIHLPQYGLNEQQHLLRAKGVTRQEKWAAHGFAEYEHAERRKVPCFLTVHPDLFYPYLLVDTSTRSLTREQYRLGGVLGYALGALGLGVGGEFSGVSQFGRSDPRPLSRLGDFAVRAVASYTLPYYVLAAEGSYRYYTESLSTTNKKEDRQDYVYYLRGFGLYDHNLSVQKRFENLKHILAEQTYVLQAAPRKAYWPLVAIAYRRQNTFGRTQVYNKIAETHEQQWEGKLGVPFLLAQQRFILLFATTYRERLGEEIDYTTHTVNTSPLITEEREYHRSVAWYGKYTTYQFDVAYSYFAPNDRVHAEYIGALHSMDTQYRQKRYYYVQDALYQQLALTYRHLFSRIDALLRIQGAYYLPLQNRTQRTLETRFLEQLINYTDQYYNVAKFRLQTTIEGGYLLAHSHRVAIALTGAYAQMLDQNRTDWLWLTTLRYEFFNRN